MSDRSDDHSRFEELCALEMVDQLSLQERLDLDTHRASCPACEAWLSDAHAVSSHLLISHQFSGKPAALPSGADARFVAEAHRRGMALQDSQGSAYLSRIKLAAAAILLVAVGIAMGFSIHQATHSVSQNAAVRSEARPAGLVGRTALSPSSTVTNPLRRAPLLRRVGSRRAKREARPTHMVQNSPPSAWSQQSGTFQMRSVIFDFKDCCHFDPQTLGQVTSPNLQPFRTFPRFGGAWPSTASPERVFRYEAALLPLGATVSPSQTHSAAFPTPQFPPFSLNLEHTR